MSYLIRDNNNGIKFKNSDIRLLDDLFIDSGYVLDFTDRTFSEFFEDEANIDIDEGRYQQLGGSKGKRLRAFVQKGEPQDVKKILYALWDYSGQPDEKKDKFDSLISVVEGTNLISTDGIDTFKVEETLEEIVSSIKRDIDANKPNVAMDSIHTYCVKRFKYLLDKHGIEYGNNPTLENLVSLYRNHIQNNNITEHKISLAIMKSFGNVWKEFNDVRNNRSTSHDNEILSNEEARYVFDVITAMLRFIKHIENE